MEMFNYERFREIASAEGVDERWIERLWLSPRRAQAMQFVAGTLHASLPEQEEAIRATIRAWLADYPQYAKGGMV